MTNFEILMLAIIEIEIFHYSNDDALNNFSLWLSNKYSKCYSKPEFSNLFYANLIRPIYRIFSKNFMIIFIVDESYIILTEWPFLSRCHRLFSF